MTEPDRAFQRRRLAYRQAGYAVARYTQGRPLGRVDLSGPPDQPWADLDPPRRTWPVDLGSSARHRLELQALALWAGLLSEARGCLDDREPPGGWGPAREPIADLGSRVTRSPDENRAYLEWLRLRAQGLLDLPDLWAAVEALAERLLTAGPLEPREAAAIIGGVEQARRRRAGLGSWLRGLR